MYNPNSMIATEFIDHQEILDSLAYAEANKSNYALIDSLIERPDPGQGLSAVRSGDQRRYLLGDRQRQRAAGEPDRADQRDRI